MVKELEGKNITSFIGERGGRRRSPY